MAVSVGCLNATALAVAKDFDTLYQASLELLRVFCRLQRLLYHRSRAIEISKGSWGYAVTGITAEKLQLALEKYQESLVRWRSTIVTFNFS